MNKENTEEEYWGDDSDWDEIIAELHQALNNEQLEAPLERLLHTQCRCMGVKLTVDKENNSYLKRPLETLHRKTSETLYRILREKGNLSGRGDSACVDFYPVISSIEHGYSDLLLDLEKLGLSTGDIREYLKDQLLIDFAHEETDEFTTNPFNLTKEEIAQIIVIGIKRKENNHPISDHLLDFLLSGADRCIEGGAKRYIEDEDNPTIKSKIVPWAAASELAKPKAEIQQRILYMVHVRAKKKELTLQDFGGRIKLGSHQDIIRNEVATIINDMGMYTRFALTKGAGSPNSIKAIIDEHLKEYFNS